MVRFSCESRSDSELLLAHVAGDRYAFEELFQRHRTRLYRTARSRGASVEDADDALQEALLSALRGAASFRRECAVSSWLHRIVVNVCLDRFRRDALPCRLFRGEPPAAVPDRTGQVETALLVRQALLRLPAEQRAAVLTVDMHGYSVADAAEMLNVAEGTIKSRCARARARLALLLGPSLRPEGG